MIYLTRNQIEDIADYLDSGLRCFYNKKTTKIITINEFENLDDLKENSFDNFLEFERLDSNSSFEIMSEFVIQLKNGPIKEKLINVLHKSKPFRNFRLLIDNSAEYRQQWFDYKFKKNIEWVESQIISYNNIEENEIESDIEIEDFEEWEDDAYFFDRKDWGGLLKLRKRRLEKNPEDLHTLERYAIALNLNKKFEETLELLAPLRQKYYKSNFGVYEIMEALIALGKSEKDFEWVEMPIILKLNKETIRLCEKFLKGKRKPRSVGDIYSHLIVKADFLYFDEKSLAKFLCKYPNLFDISGNLSDYWNIEFKLILQKKK